MTQRVRGADTTEWIREEETTEKVRGADTTERIREEETTEKMCNGIVSHNHTHYTSNTECYIYS